MIKRNVKSFRYLVLAGGICAFASVANAGFEFQGAPSVSMPAADMAPAAVMPPVSAEPIDMPAPQPYIPPASTAEFDEPVQMPAQMDIPVSSGYAKGGAFQAGTYMKTKLEDPTAGMEVASLPPTTAGMRAYPDQSLVIRNSATTYGEPSYVATPSVPMTEAQSWRARQGESVREVLQRWSSRSGVNLVWDNAGSATVAQDISYFGSFEDAVDELIHKSTGEGLESQFQSGTIAESSYTEMDMTASAYAPSAYGRDYSENMYSGYGGNRWEVVQGSSLRSILEQWSQRNGSKIIWNADKDYTFNQPFFVQGSYEEAVERALGQFGNQGGAPYGEIYQDPLTSAPVLVVNNG